jgi:outer membrane protein OmpA-like peptidoglycan-associated protein
MLGGDLVIDTFSVTKHEQVVSTDLGPFAPSAGDKDLFVFNDSIILFSSMREGGYGGYDIYYSIKRNGSWSKAMNIGEKVNSFYDDVSPFLTLNGRSLYFSSNRLESIGGLDVFNTVFNDTLILWSEAENLGIPINSASDDAHFFVSADGLTGFYSSDRKSGFGERDIYAAYMKQPITENLALAFPPTFIQLMDRTNPVSTRKDQGDDAVVKEDIKEYYIGDLLFEEDDVVLTPQNLKKLEVLSNLLLIYPTLRADLICHDISEGPKSFDLYFSIKKAEEVADFLARKGINRNRLYIKGCGAFYPRTITPKDAKPNPTIRRLNRRIEVNLYGTESLPIAIINDNPNVPEEYINPLAIEFRKNHGGLVYRVQIASVSQLLQNEIFDNVDNAMIQWDPSTRTYKYFVGMTTDYNEARELRGEIRSRGFGDAFIVAHYNGKLVNSSDISMLAGAYPDLLRMERGE